MVRNYEDCKQPHICKPKQLCFLDDLSYWMISLCWSNQSTECDILL